MVDIGPIDRRISVYKIPESETPNEYSFRIMDYGFRPGVNAYWVSVVQSNGEMAWSSPIYVVRSRHHCGRRIQLTFFSAPGRENLDSTMALAKKAAEELGLSDVVVASTAGFTAKKAIEAFNDMGVKLIFAGTVRERFPAALIEELKGKGCNVCFSHEVQYDYPDAMKAAYRRFGEGMKVAVEIAMIALLCKPR